MPVSSVPDVAEPSLAETSSGSNTVGKSLRQIFWTALTWIFISLIALIVVIALVVPRIMGAVPLVVLTGSMQPSIRPGDVVVVQPTPVNELEIGDVITFQPVSGNPSLTTHRIINILHDDSGNVLSVTTQGDANNVADPPIIPDQINGRVRYQIPLVGYLTVTRNAITAATTVLGIGLITYSLLNVIQHFRTKSEP